MQHFISHYGYIGLFFISVVSSACLPVPSEVAYGLAGAYCTTAFAAHPQFTVLNVVIIGTIGSVVGSTGNAGQVHYAAAKAGLVGFSKALAKEVATRNITVNTVAPGFVETDMTRALPVAHRAAYLAQIPVGRFGTAEEVASAVLFLASRDAGYITGQTLHVNGGMYMG